MGERDRRIGMNEAVFREVNERIEDLAEAFKLEGEPLDLLCECGDPNCVQRITMSRSDYEKLRSDSLQFAVSPGHEVTEAEELIERGRGYDVVRKRSKDAVAVAEQTDPRS